MTTAETLYSQDGQCARPKAADGLALAPTKLYSTKRTSALTLQSASATAGFSPADSFARRNAAVALPRA
jgi:hypothetical protein